MISVTSATGPLFDLLLSVTYLLLLWCIQKPILHPFLLWEPIAMIAFIVVSIGAFIQAQQKEK